MIIKQLSVFVQNESGRLMEVTEALHEANVNISALNIAETAEYGVLRMIVDDIEKAVNALKDLSYSIKVTDVLCVEMPDVPGSLNRVLKALLSVDLNVAYMYGYSNDGKAPLILKVVDNERAQIALKEAELE
ncbi:ACT domain-containing protein [Anaerovorax sp. IOR16]|uniref:ACT domain-containing protein n=1 Tax=Anaerovorax sp. IOR16 TaxID=2773458 RepID=UPI0019D03A37|nr:ACT domain-containing protein [Anaerovorax sp. IOR16]